MIGFHLANLTSDHWNLLSNIIIRSYDGHNIINQVKTILNQKSSLPPELRLKPENTIKLHSLPIQSIMLLVEQSSHFHSLSNHARRALTLYSAFQTGDLYEYLGDRDSSAFRNPIYMVASSIIYESDFMMNQMEIYIN